MVAHGPFGIPDQPHGQHTPGAIRDRNVRDVPVEEFPADDADEPVKAVDDSEDAVILDQKPDPAKAASYLPSGVVGSGYHGPLASRSSEP